MEKGQNIKISQVFKHYWRGIRPRKTIFWVSYVSMFVVQVINVLVPIFYKKFFDQLGSSQEKSIIIPTLISIIVTVLVLKLIVWLISRVGMYSISTLQSRTMANLRQNAFDYLIDHSYSFFTNNFSGSLVQRVSRFSRSFESISDSIAFSILPLIVAVTGSLIVTWFVAPIISIALMIWVLSFSTFNILFSRWKLKYDIAVAEADSKTTGYLADSITNSSAVSLFTGQKYESVKFKEVTNDQANKLRFSWILGDVVDGVQTLLIAIIEFVIFYYAIRYWNQGLATIGTFVLAQTYIIGLANQLWGLNRFIRKIYEGIADAKEMVEILEMPYDIKDMPKAKKLQVVKAGIEFKDVSFGFSETKEVISNLNLNIKPGEKVALIGPSGAGKTTFIRMIMRMYDISKGSIEIDGQNIQKVTQNSLRENISLVPQDPVLFHRTLLDNIRYGRRDATDAEVIEAARLAHCDEFIESLPLKYDTYVGERGIKLSGGERQRVAIARAILKKAPILILDEATSSLDSHSEKLIQDALDNLMRGCTTIVIAHRLSTIKKMDRIIAMKDGKIVEEGTHEELANKDSGLYKDLWELQAGGFIQQ
ncbi:MAG: ABC transporter ATP-binding protein [bacterium]